MAIDNKVAGVTLSVTASDVRPLTAAVMVVPPGVNVFANPLDPGPLLIEATADAELLQVVMAVRFCTLPSL